MGDIETGLGRAVLYTLSGGFVSVAFGVLGATAAEAKPVLNDGGDPGSAMKTAGAVPGMGVFKVADAASKVVKNAGPPPNSGGAKDKGTKEKGGGEQRSKPDAQDSDSGSGKEKQKRDSGEKKSPERDQDRESSKKALKTAGMLPGMGAVKVLNDANEKAENAGRSRAEKHEESRNAGRPARTAVDEESNGKASRGAERDRKHRTGTGEVTPLKLSDVPVVGGYAKLADTAKKAVTKAGRDRGQARPVSEAAPLKLSDVPIVGGYAKLADTAKDLDARVKVRRAAGSVPVAGALVKAADATKALQARAGKPQRVTGQATNAALTRPANTRSVPAQWDDDGPIIHWPWCPTRDCDRAMKYLFSRSPRLIEEPAGAEGKILEPKDDLLFGAEGGYYVRKARVVTPEGRDLAEITVGADGKTQVTRTRDGGFNFNAEGFAGIRSAGAGTSEPAGPVNVSGVPEGDFGVNGHAELVVTPTEGVKAGAGVGAEVKSQTPEFAVDLGPFRLKVQPEGRVGTGVDAEGSFAPDADGKWHFKGKGGFSSGVGVGTGFDISLAD
ncbi:hypothetical protein [Amycolatopsis sp. lyj-346]|uniref:hypothetical protein n=1 Tax=Amycolatopsis sp. lyj-346 TaxID=2789289 RepID=UPI00397D5419